MKYRGVTVKFLEEDLEILRKVAEARGISLSDLIREAVRSKLAELCYLSEEEKKALGVK